MLDEAAPPELSDILAASGMTAARIEERMTAATTSMSEAVALSCDRHTALIVLTRTAVDAAGNAVARQTLRLIADGLSYGPD